jgi:hypothetical protein
MLAVLLPVMAFTAFSMFSLFNKSFRDCAWLLGAISNAAMSICQKTNLFILVVTVMIWN